MKREKEAASIFSETSSNPSKACVKTAKVSALTSIYEQLETESVELTLFLLFVELVRN